MPVLGSGAWAQSCSSCLSGAGVLATAHCVCCDTQPSFTLIDNLDSLLLLTTLSSQYSSTAVIFSCLYLQELVVTMKNNLVIAAAALLGAADAGMHRMKLQKVPLTEQLVR